jgi:hypothetical protein
LLSLLVLALVALGVVALRSALALRSTLAV